MEKKRLKYPRENVVRAIEAIKNEGLSIRKAAKLYNVPKTTLIDTMREKYTKPGNIGGPTVLTENEENILVDWVVQMGEMGFPVTKSQVLESVGKLVKNLNRETPFKNNIPGKKWYNSFLSRHPEISKRVPQALTSSRAAVTEVDIRKWFGRVKTYFTENDLLDVLDDPSRIFNCDEAGFYMSPQEKQVLVRKGSKKVYNRTANDEKECLTVLLTISASGSLPPPLVIYPYKRYVPAAIVAQMPRQWGVGYTESGWMTSESFYEYVANVFHPWLKENNVQFPVVLFLDGHSSHINLSISEFCKENGIILTAFYPNSTHRLQPLDVGVFFPLKNCWRNEVRSWRMENCGQKLQRSAFAKLLKKTIDSVITASVVSSAFKSCGLFPFNENNIDYTKLVKQVGSELAIGYKNGRANINNNQIMANNKANTCCMMEKISDSEFLHHLQTRMDVNVLEMFKNAGSAEDVDEQFKALFNLWNGLVTSSQGNHNLPDDRRFISDVTSSEIANLSINDINFDDLFNDINTVEANVTADGSLTIILPETSCLPVQKESDELALKSDTLASGDNQTLKTPEKENQEKPKLPTPFKNALYWPESSKRKNSGTDKTNQLKKPKMYPTVATSDEFMAYQKSVEEEKEQKNLEKQDRIRKRKEKTKDKETNKLKAALKQVSTNNKTDQENYEEGNFVIFKYEEDFFPGQILEKVEGGVKIKAMSPSGQFWKWPKDDDILDYPLSDLICKIDPPSQVTSRGSYSVEKIDSFRK